MKFLKNQEDLTDYIIDLEKNHYRVLKAYDNNTVFPCIANVEFHRGLEYDPNDYATIYFDDKIVREICNYYIDNNLY